MLELDLKDRILLFLALGESVLILLYHILFSHPIFLFIIRIAKMLEQVTICFILLKLTLNKVNLRVAFTYSVYVSLFAIVIVGSVVTI